MGLLSKFFTRKSPQLRDAEAIYAKLLAQSRNPRFYGPGRVADNYDGRIDFLTLHIAPVLHVLRRHGKNGKALSQAIFDVMRDDFDIALREEGISDTGVSRRIKPMMQLFYTRLKSYTDALMGASPEAALADTFKAELLPDQDVAFKLTLARYVKTFHADILAKSLGDIAQANFEFPDP